MKIHKIYDEVLAFTKKFEQKTPLNKKEIKKVNSIDIRIFLAGLRKSNPIFVKLKTISESEFIKFMNKWSMDDSPDGWFSKDIYLEIKEKSGEKFARDIHLGLAKGEYGLFENEKGRFKAPPEAYDFINEIEYFQKYYPELIKNKLLRKKLTEKTRKEWNKMAKKDVSFSVIRELFKKWYGSSIFPSNKELAMLRTKLKRARQKKFLP